VATQTARAIQNPQKALQRLKSELLRGEMMILSWNKKKIFISYSHMDDKIVYQMTEEFNKAKIKYFLDKKSIGFGDDIKYKIKKYLKKATYLVVIVSPSSIKSHWVSYEIGLADSQEIKIIPFITHPDIELPFYCHGKKHCSSISELIQYIENIDICTSVVLNYTRSP